MGASDIKVHDLGGKIGKNLEVFSSFVGLVLWGFFGGTLALY